jgi:hypothetical protein
MDERQFYFRYQAPAFAIARLRSMEPRPQRPKAAPSPQANREYWWSDVLHDPRARWPSEKRLAVDSRHAYLRLDCCRDDTLELSCSRCGVRRTFDTADVIRQFGRDYNTVVLRHRLVRCAATRRDAVYEPCHLEFAHWCGDREHKAPPDEGQGLAG